MFPAVRLRRLRQNPALRDLVRETHIRVSQMIYPLFIVEGKDEPQPIISMPGIVQWPLNHLPGEVKRLAALGIQAVLLFGIPLEKDELGTQGYASEGIIQRAIKSIKEAVPEMLVITDVCLCEYTSHGHCGIIQGNTVENDSTLDLLSRMAISHVEAGADIVAPSDMMDGRIGALRRALDEHGYTNTPIMSYAVKYASGFYGPFRDAAGSTPQFGDRRTYQMDPANGREALREVELDLGEGADIVIVKPALAYLDVIRAVSERVHVPVAAYNVSGEYSMIKAAVAQGWLEEKRIVMEVLQGINRAGADMLITYFAPDVAQWLHEF